MLNNTIRRRSCVYSRAVMASPSQDSSSASDLSYVFLAVQARCRATWTSENTSRYPPQANLAPGRAAPSSTHSPYPPTPPTLLRSRFTARTYNSRNVRNRSQRARGLSRSSRRHPRPNPYPKCVRRMPCTQSQGTHTSFTSTPCITRSDVLFRLLSAMAYSRVPAAEHAVSCASTLAPCQTSLYRCRHSTRLCCSIRMPVCSALCTPWLPGSGRWKVLLGTAGRVGIPPWTRLMPAPLPILPIS